MNKKTGLGKGFDSLLPTNFDSSLLMDKDERIQKIAVTDVHPSESQPRKAFDKEALLELGSSIKQYGILQPLIVVPDKLSSTNTFIIVAGERRWRAAKQVGLKHVPCIVREREELEQLEISLIENVQRVDLTPIEQAISIERLHQEFAMSYQAIASRLGKAPTTINNIVRLLRLPQAARQALDERRISEGHARAILALIDYPDEQGRLLQNILSQNWSVRQAEQYVTAIKQGKKQAGAKTRTSVENEQTKRLSASLNTKVTLKHTAKGGRLELHFTDDKTYEALVNKLLGN